MTTVERAPRPADSPGPDADVEAMGAAARMRPHGRYARTWRDEWPLRRLLIVLMAIAGLVVMLYPTAAAWFSDRAHAGQVSAYVDTTGAMSLQERQVLLSEARAYNATLPEGPLRDPYTFNASGTATEVGDGVAAYRGALAIGTGGMMGVLAIPEIGVDLPIFHGTSDATLAKGVGHVYGSSLPVGGEGTHAVLTGHSGFVTATLFNDLQQLRTGDVFTVTVAGEVLTYRVDQILTVLPNDSDALRREPDKDYLTLITCTPTGVNSHRLLVRGERIPTVSTEVGSGAIRSDVLDPGLPWWALGIATGVVGIVLVTLPLRAHSRGLPRHARRLG